MFRTHTCGELTKNDVGSEVTLAGWVNKIRNLGDLIFIDLRDRYGLTQITVNQDAKDALAVANKVHNEYVIKVTGKVGARDDKNVNKDISTGEIELMASEVEILSQAKPQPFEIFDTDKDEPKEELRLKYRYLDLRRRKMLDIMLFRNQMINHIRKYMDERDYIHVDTPILTSSSPEGARDYIVPSRLHPGKFYALPQAPQQFKQLLMVAGFDKYYQIANCLRDEDPRADRQREFLQLDVECSFKTSAEFFDEVEPLFVELTEQLTDKKVWKTPFPRIPYMEAMEKYGIDKPDLRYDLELADVTEWAQASDFNVFKSAEQIRVLWVPGGEEMARKDIDELEKEAKTMGAKGLAWMKYDGKSFDGGITKFISDDQQKSLVELLKLDGKGILLFVADKLMVALESLGKVRIAVANKLDLIDDNMIAWAWIVDFPLYEKDEETGKIDFSHNPFSMPVGGIESLNNLDPLDVRADQYDLVANGYEAASGAVRNYDPETMFKAFELVGYDRKVVEEKFAGMLDAFTFGAPPHCGFAPGLERLIMVLLGKDDIKEVVPFPKTNAGEDLMMNAPSDVDEEQLKELHIEVVKKDK